MSNFPDPRIPKFESGKTLEDQLRAKKLNDFVAYVVSQTPIAGNGVTIQSSNQGRIISAPIRTIAYAGANNPYAMGNAQYASNPSAVDTGGNYTGGGGTLGQWGGVSVGGGGNVVAGGGVGSRLLDGYSLTIDHDPPPVAGFPRVGEVVQWVRPVFPVRVSGAPTPIVPVRPVRVDPHACGECVPLDIRVHRWEWD